MEPIPAAPVEIKPVPAVPGWRTSEAKVAAAGWVVGLVTLATELLPQNWRWIGAAVIAAVSHGYIRSRGDAKR